MTRYGRTQLIAGFDRKSSLHQSKFEYRALRERHELATIFSRKQRRGFRAGRSRDSLLTC